MEQNSNILEPLKGIVDKTGTHFEITDSEYLNITLDSSKEIKLRLESIPEMITLYISKPTNEDPDFFTEITISGLNPNTTYHKYEDHYYNHVAFTTDENGSYSYNHNVSEYTLVFIQPRSSTYFLREAGWFDELNNPLPPTIATWDSSPGVRTATLETDITGQSIDIKVSDATLDGKGYTTTGSETGHGILLANLNYDITIKNIQITNFSKGINIYINSTNIILSNISVFNNTCGIYIYRNISGTTIENNDIYDNSTGVSLIQDNISNIIINNTLHNNVVGIGLEGINSSNTIQQNIFYNHFIAIAFGINNNNNDIVKNCILNNNIGINIQPNNNNNNIENNNFINSPNTNAYNNGNNNFDSNYWDNYIAPPPYIITPTGQDNNPLSTPYDVIPPTTTINLTGTVGDNDWYVSDVEVTLTSTDNPCGSGVDKTYYSFDGTNFTEYTDTFSISNECITTIYYYSVDKSGNKEPTKTKEIKIDKTPPEININVPADGSEYILNQNVPSDWSASDDCSGIASETGTAPNGAPIDTSSLGNKPFTVSATNNAGLYSSTTTTYNVIAPQRGIKLDKFLIKKDFIFEYD